MSEWTAGSGLTRPIRGATDSPCVTINPPSAVGCAESTNSWRCVRTGRLAQSIKSCVHAWRCMCVEVEAHAILAVQCEGGGVTEIDSQSRTVWPPSSKPWPAWLV
jgi:hypothetical protein